MPSMFGVQNKSPLVPARNAYNSAPRVSAPRVSAPQPSLPRGGYGPSTGISAVPPRIPQLPKSPQPTMPTGGYGTRWEGGMMNNKFPSNQPTIPTSGYGANTGINAKELILQGQPGMGGISQIPPTGMDPIEQEKLRQLSQGRGMFGVNTGFTGNGPVPMM